MMVRYLTQVSELSEGLAGQLRIGAIPVSLPALLHRWAS